ncbi:MAG: sigma-54-dependent Fis family transcriptional regulator [Bryobacterales bacterium]|nr:sigma-54-dependent Fis family transcriptional regulator [Bryobacterales bacterium]
MRSGSKNETILVVEDEPEVRSYIEVLLRCQGYNVQNTENGEEALEYLDNFGSNVSLVLMDVVMPRKNGLATLQQLRRSHKNLPVVMLSGASSTPTIVEAMKGGASDFLAKPVSHTELVEAIEKALSASPVYTAPFPEAAGKGSSPRNGSAGQSFLGGAWMRRMTPYLKQIGASDAPVLIQGETGAGKELVAGFLHTNSSRANRPFLKLNCAALPSELVESELFGFEKGAFTGAFKSKPGKFDLADTGTLLLDEIGDMDFKLQAKLLQVLQDQQFERLGGRETVRVNVRVLAATHCDLEKAIAVGRFREDLYHRLNVINVCVPPLRERMDEIPALCQLFLAKHATPGTEPPEITRSLLDALTSYRWPGNVRELENFMRKFLVIRDAEMLTADLHTRMRPRESAVAVTSPGSEPAVPAETPKPSMEKVTEAQRKMEAEVILGALNKTRWNRKQAASMLGVDYKALLYKMKKLGLEDRQSAAAPAREPASKDWESASESMRPWTQIAG